MTKDRAGAEFRSDPLERRALRAANQCELGYAFAPMSHASGPRKPNPPTPSAAQPAPEAAPSPHPSTAEAAAILANPARRCAVHSKQPHQAADAGSKDKIYAGTRATPLENDPFSGDDRAVKCLLGVPDCAPVSPDAVRHHEQTKGGRLCSPEGPGPQISNLAMEARAATPDAANCDQLIAKAAGCA